MSTRGYVALGLSVLVLLSGVGTVAGGVPAERADDGRSSPTAAAAVGDDAAIADENRSEILDENRVAQYKVSLRNITIDTWLLRNSTVRNATVREVVVRNATTPDGTRENVTLENVTVGEFVIDRGRLQNVTAQTLVVRNKSVLDVPGGDFIDPDVRDRTIERHWTRNQTVSGVVIDTLVVDAGIMEENATLGEEADDAADFSPVEAEDSPDITVENGTVGEALIINGAANDWSVDSVGGTDASEEGESGDSEDDSNSENDSDDADRWADR